MERRRSEGETRKGPWTAEEDEILINFVNMNGPRDWSSIRSKGLLPRTGKSCRLRWVNKLRPNLKKGCKFSAEEERVVLDLQATVGNRWATIASYLPGRTDNDVKNFWSTRQKRLARIFGSSFQTSCSLKNKSSSKVLLMDSDEASSSHQVFKSSSNKVNEASPSTCRLCSCFCTGSSNDLTAMLQCTPGCRNPQCSTTIELVNTSLPLLMTDDVQAQQVVQPSCSYSPLFGLPAPPTAISSSSLHFSLGQQQQYPHPVDFPPFARETDDDDTLYFSMEVAEPISAMDVLACQETLQLVNNIPEIDLGEEVVDQSPETQSYERSDQDNIPVPDNVFNDLPADLFEYLEKVP